MFIYLIGIGIIGIDFSFYQSNPNGFQSLSSKRPFSSLLSSHKKNPATVLRLSRDS